MKENTDTAFSRLDHAFAEFLSAKSDLQGAEKSCFHRILLALSSQLNQGHSCLLLDAEAQALTQASGLIAPEKSMPLVLEQNRLYLHRYWAYEQRLAQQIKLLLQQPPKQPITASNSLLLRYFPEQHDTTDWQKLAAQKALEQNVSLITGGPGTGKTTTVVKILALLQELAGQPLAIALAAPTGKAAMRLQESLSHNKQTLPCSAQLQQLIPESVSTIHRLLGAKLHSPYFQHHAEQPLPYDLLVIDEASMVDLALMSKLVDALKPGARLILLGDKDQLASVESGAVLADLTSALPDQTQELKTAFRFQAQIKQLAILINTQQAAQAWKLINAGHQELQLLQSESVEFIAARYHLYLQNVASGADFIDIFQTYSQFQVLCANRHGPTGVSDINRRVEQRLLQQQVIKSGDWYAGRPVMVTQNDPALQLFNGDIGLCLPERQENGRLMVYFLRPDGSVRAYLPARLPHCETVYAMSIHKSQGSEFSEVLILLPQTVNPVLTKELLYTAITRAKSRVFLATEEQVFKHTVMQQVTRAGGLAQKLMEE